MDLGMFDILCPSLKTRTLIDERKFDMNRSDKYNDIYVIPMHRKNVWTNKWMSDPRNKFLQASHYDPSAQYKKSWGSLKRKRGLTLCYSCRRLGHLAKECLGRKPSCLCCKAMDHEVLDCPRMIARLEKMDMEQAKHEGDQETNIIEEPQQESEKVLIQMKKTLKEHKYVQLPEIFKEKEQVEERIGDFDIDCILDEETQVNIMPERNWEAIGKPTMISSLGGIGLFIGKLMMLCGKLTQIPLIVNGTLIKEDFEIIKFIEDNAPFTMILRKPWIERDQSGKKEEEEVLEQQRQELKDFMTKWIAQLIKEEENHLNPYDTRSPYVEAKATQKAAVSTLDKEEVIYLNLRRESHQHEVTMSKENKNQNEKRITKTNLIEKKARKLSKKKSKIEKLQMIPEGTSQQDTL
jgi:hypothetical protein